MHRTNPAPRLTAIFLIVVISLLLSSCPEGLENLLQDGFVPFIGPSGGYVFYENPDWKTDGWRYLEAAPSDIIINSNDGLHIFGYHRVEGSYIHIGTDVDIGKGEANTIALVGAMEATAYDDQNNSTSTTSIYAAKLCSDYVADSASDWFLPSKEELNLLHLRLFREDLGNFSDGQYYWSSSEYVAESQNSVGKYAYRIWFNSELDLENDYWDIYGIMEKHWRGRVRPIRYYTP